MKSPIASIALGAATAALLFASPVDGAESNDKPMSGPAKNGAPQLFAYKAPLRGAPATRVGGGTRSFGKNPPIVLSVLAPNETGYTTREKPIVYWYVSETLDTPVELTLSSTASLEEASKPALEITLQPPIRKGVHALALGEHGVALKPGVEYQWFVAVVSDAARRSNDVVAGGSIERVAETPAVRSRIDAAQPAERAALYAGEGIWYDVIDQLSQSIGADPGNRALRAQRAALLEQVGLSEAAEFDRAP
jgi:hypothetical protein